VAAYTGSLIAQAIEAHGGLGCWHKLKRAGAHCVMSGDLWGAKAVAGILTNFQYQFDLHRQRGTFPRFLQPDLYATFTADCVRIENTEGTVLEELQDPSASLEGQTLQTEWSKLQLIYFVGYAIWNYLTVPFCFLMPGFEIEELEPVQHGAQILRRLSVIFPEGFARHTKQQNYYFGLDGLLVRIDYVAEPVTKETVMAHYITEHNVFSGITVGTRQQIYVMNPDGGHTPDSMLYALDVKGVVFS